MKTKELIRRLHNADPSGNMDCCVGNTDIYFVSTEPAYWDGCKQILIRDKNCEGYNVIGAKVSSKGKKLVIHELSIKSAIWNDPDLPIEYDQYSRNHYQKDYVKLSKEVKDYIDEIEEQEKNEI